jgi:hypothetical protein
MLAHRFAQLDQATIAVELSQNGLKKSLRGIGTYGRDPELGSVLRINVRESWGDFDFVLKEDDFAGEITRGGPSGCEFQICLTAECLCTT